MKKLLFSLLPLVAAMPLVAADAKSDVTAAVKSLEGKDYSWKTSVTVPEGSRFRPGPTEGKTQKGVSHVVMTFNDNKSEMIIQGDKSAVKRQDGDWQSAAELSNEGQGQGRGFGNMARNFRAPAAEAADLLQYAKEIKKEGDAYVTELNDEGAKKYVSFRRGGGQGGGDAPTVSNSKGTAKFWTKDGVLSKYEYHVQGTVSVGGNDREVDRKTTVEIKDVGNTKVEVPEAAKKKLS